MNTAAGTVERPATAEGVVVDEGAQPGTGLALVQRSSVLLVPVMDVALAQQRLKEFEEFCRGYLKESKDGGVDGGDYGVIPGAGTKKVLMKSGAEKLCEIYGLYDEYEIIQKVEDWDRGLFDYELRCVIKSRRDDSIVGTGLGSCSSFESKYRWRVAQRKCPVCRAEAVIKGRKEYDKTGGDGGWLCFKKKGGCGEQFTDTDTRITSQDVGRVENPDIIDTKNTVLKMAKKRAKIDAVIGVTRSSGIFTQDMEDTAVSDVVKVEAVEGEVVKAGAQESDTPTQRTQSAPAGSTASSNGNGGRKISESQAKRLFAIARDADVRGDDYKAFLKRHGYDDDRDVLRSDYDALCDELQKG